MLFRYKPNSSSLFASRNQVEIGKLAQMLRGGSVAQTQFFSNFSRTSLVGKGRVFFVRLRKQFQNIAPARVANGGKKSIYKGIEFWWSARDAGMRLVQPRGCRLLSRHS